MCQWSLGEGHNSSQRDQRRKHSSHFVPHKPHGTTVQFTFKKAALAAATVRVTTNGTVTASGSALRQCHRIPQNTLFVWVSLGNAMKANLKQSTEYTPRR
jgi:hypothetical protein